MQSNIPKHLNSARADEMLRILLFISLQNHQDLMVLTKRARKISCARLLHESCREQGRIFKFRPTCRVLMPDRNFQSLRSLLDGELLVSSLGNGGQIGHMLSCIGTRQGLIFDDNLHNKHFFPDPTDRATLPYMRSLLPNRDSSVLRYLSVRRRGTTSPLWCMSFFAILLSK